MSTYVYAIRSKKQTIATDLKGKPVLMNHAPFIEKYWDSYDYDKGEEVTSFTVRPLKGIVTRAEKYDDNGELADYVIFSEPNENPKYSGEEGVHFVYNRNRMTSWFDEPDYNNEGAVAVAKWLKQENPKLKKKRLLFVPRYAKTNKSFTLVHITNIIGTFENPILEVRKWNPYEEKWSHEVFYCEEDELTYLETKKPELVKPY